MILDDLGGEFSFQCFDDSKAKRPYLIKVLHGTLEQHQNELTSLNIAGAGVFFTVNETDGKGRRGENIIKVRALFTDFDTPDGDRTFDYYLPPSYAIESSPGKHHAYWIISDELPIDEFRPLMLALAEMLGGDTKICTQQAVLRVPGFIHQKSDPFLVREVFKTCNRYTAEKLKEWICPNLVVVPKKKETSFNIKPHLADDPDALTELSENIDILLSAEEGSRNNTLNRVAFQAYGLWKAGRLSREYVTSQLLDAAIDIGLSESEAETTMRSARKKAVPIPNVLDDIPLLPNLPACDTSHRTSETRFKLLSGTELNEIEPQRWIVQGILPNLGLSCIYGASGSGKSFLTIDMCFDVARGSDWFGLKTASVPVTYVCLEGQNGICKRIKALERFHDESLPDNFKIILGNLSLINEATALAESIIAQNGKGGLIIIDTFAQAAPGLDENSGKDISLIIASCKRLQSLTDSLVLLVAHSGKDHSRGLRGHSSLFAALDACIEVTKSDSLHEWKLSKSKDDIDGTKYAFTLQSITVDSDKDGDDITSCVVIPGNNGLKRKQAPRSGNQKIIWSELEAILPLTEPDEDGRRMIGLDEAIEQTHKKLSCAKKDQKRRTREAIQALARRNLIQIKGNQICLI